MNRTMIGPWWMAVALVGGVALAWPAPVVAQQEERARQLAGKLLEQIETKKPREAKPGDDELVALLKQRYNVALEELKIRCAEYKQALGPTEPLFDSARRFLDAELALATGPREKVPILEQALAVEKWYEARLESALDAGLGTRAALLRVRYARLGVEIDLVRARRAAESLPPK